MSRPTTVMPACVSRLGRSAMRLNELTAGSYTSLRTNGPLVFTPPSRYSFPPTTADCASARATVLLATEFHFSVPVAAGVEPPRVVEPSVLEYAELPTLLYARTR